MTDRQRQMLEEAARNPEGYATLHDHADDRVASNLSKKGLGYVARFGHLYSWRKRNGYFNLFYINEAGTSSLKGETS